MASTPIMTQPVIVEGQVVGHAEAFIGRSGDGTIATAIRFRRNWPGWWHAMALILDGPPASERG